MNIMSLSKSPQPHLRMMSSTSNITQSKGCYHTAHEVLGLPGASGDDCESRLIHVIQSSRCF